jgi:putative MATE family efflux protein
MEKQTNISYKAIIFTALPIVLQYLITTSINFFDSFMVGRLGDSAVAALGIANQYYFIINVFFTGVTAGCGVLVAHYFGKKNITKVKSETGISVFVTVVGAIVFGLGAFFGASVLVGIFNASQEVAEQTSSYLKITAFSYLFQGISMSFGAASRSVRRPYIPALAGSVAFILNIVLNYLLIFGKAGFPAMGVSGAAAATLISRIVELIVLLIVFYLRKSPAAGSFKELFSFDIKAFKKSAFTVAPILFNELGFGGGLVIFSVIFSRTMVNAIAGVQIAFTVQNVFITVLFGFAGAASVFVGNEVGRGDRKAAYAYSSAILKMSFISSLIMTLLLIFLTNPIISLYEISDTIRVNARIMLYTDAAVLPLRFITLVLILGVFRGGGDLHFAFAAEIIPMWFIGIPLAAAGAWLFDFPLWGVYMIVKIEEVIKLGVSFIRYRRKRWIHNLIG